jgi:hypothetical protein
MVTRADRGQDGEVTPRAPAHAEPVTAGVLALVLALAGAGCWPHRVRGDQLRDGARSLLPPAATVVAEEEGDCVELAPSPSCVHLYFAPERGSLEERVGSVEERARAGGWALERKEFLAGGGNLRFRRGDLRAVVYVWAEQRAGPCRERPHRDCADAILVERGS